MLSHNPKLSRIVLDHPERASASDVERLKGVVSFEMGRQGASRGLLRVLADKPPMKDARFEEEACIRTPKGFLLYLALNARGRLPSDETSAREMKYAIDVLCAPRKPLKSYDIIRLGPDEATALEISELLSANYSSYPLALDSDSVSGYLRLGIPYAVKEDGKIVSALFGVPVRFGELDTVEFTLMATSSPMRGIDMTTALAAMIRTEAIERFGEPLMLAETIAGPVMRSCHDLGMELRGMLREHYLIGIKDRLYTNLYLWSL